MDLYKIISQLTQEEYEELYNSFMVNKAEKSAAFLATIRKNPKNPDREFLRAFDISAPAFYVLKSRLGQKVETYLLNRVGNTNLHILKRVLNINELMFNNPREITITALRKLEKELVRFDFPYGLMVTYKGLQNMHTYDGTKYDFYKSKYTQQVAFALAVDRGNDLVIEFFRSYDSYFMTRRDKDLNDMIKIMERIDNYNNLYESHRLYIAKAIIHIFARLFIPIPDTIRCEIEPVEKMFEQCFEILSTYEEDSLYKQLNLVFDYLRFIYYDNRGDSARSRIYFDILDYKIEELLTRYHFNVNTSLILFRKLKYHMQSNTRRELLYDVENYLSHIEIDPYRISYFINYYMFLAQSYFVNGEYKRCARLLYRLLNEVNMRKQSHVYLEVRLLQALAYVKMGDFDLANQLILSLQRQLRKTTLTNKYHNAKAFLKVLSIELGGKPKTKEKNLRNYIEKWKVANSGRYALLEDIDLESLFLNRR